MLRLHTIGTAKAIRVDDRVGTLEVGKLGDILLVDPHWPDTGPIVDLYATLVLACDRLNIASVFVAGDLVMHNGKHASIDVREVTDEVLRRVAAKPGKPSPEPAS
jgi:cytosine/adenosine deaminase-related metal-dependent hydrolase